MSKLEVSRDITYSREFILTIGLIIALIACLLPPWEVYWIGSATPPHSDIPMLMQLEHGFLFACPKEHEILKCFINWNKLITELLAIGFITGIGLVLTRGKSKF